MNYELCNALQWWEMSVFQMCFFIYKWEKLMGKGDYESSSLGEDAKEAKTWESMDEEEESLKSIF